MTFITHSLLTRHAPYGCSRTYCMQHRNTTTRDKIDTQRSATNDKQGYLIYINCTVIEILVSKHGGSAAVSSLLPVCTVMSTSVSLSSKYYRNTAVQPSSHHFYPCTLLIYIYLHQFHCHQNTSIERRQSPASRRMMRPRLISQHLRTRRQQLQHSRQQLQHSREQLRHSREQLQHSREQLQHSREQLQQYRQ